MFQFDLMTKARSHVMLVQHFEAFLSIILAWCMLIAEENRA